MILHSASNNKSNIPPEIRRNIAIQSLNKTQAITQIANDFDCSRNTVYKQQAKAKNAINQAFTANNDKVLFYIPVTKQTICTLVIALFLICKASYRNIITILSTLFGYEISIGRIANIVDDATSKATIINQRYDLSTIKTSASDEVFHRNQPIMATVDISSRFCAQANICNSRDGEDWAINLLCLQDQGYNPSTVIVDGAKGLTKGYQDTMPNTKIRYDHFHILREIKDTARFLRNKEASMSSLVLKISNRLVSIKKTSKRVKYQRKLKQAFVDLHEITEVSQQFATLSNWMQYDVLQLSGYDPAQRAELFDFIVLELESLFKRYPTDRIKKVLNSLIFQRDRLLDVANTLNSQFMDLATKYNVKLANIWNICYLARYDYASLHYQEKSVIIEDLVGVDIYEKVEDEVLFILDSTPRCSSMIENFNSRLAPYIPENKTITQKRLDLIRFYLNHAPFMRSYYKHLVGKSPAEALTGTKHDVWFKMLGFEAPQRIAA